MRRRCLRCHDDPELTAFNGDEEVSAYLAEEAYAASVHADNAWVDCHRDLAGTKRRRHSEDLEPVNCDDCHEAQAKSHNDSLHGAAAERGFRIFGAVALAFGLILLILILYTMLFGYR